jgi:apolipoprotein D and lipocalin family protein
MKWWVASLAVFVSAVAATGCATTTERLQLPPLTTVAKVDLPRYLGTWYEIASFPQSFQKGCTATTAHYALKPDGEIEVVNTCHRNTIDGELTTATGRARVVDTATDAKLEVSFFGPFWGDYWVIELADDYSYAVVGNPGRDYLWILSRTSSMEPKLYDGIVQRLQERGFEIGKLQKTPQPPMP